MKTLLCLALVSLTIAAAQSPRETIGNAEIFAALEVQPGQTVGEIGAGGGELSIAAARLVGASGRVLTSELGANRMAALQRAVKESGVAQVSVVEGAPDSTNFPDACCDAIFMRNVYHHFGDPAAMNASIFRSLKPGGRVAVIDFKPSRDRPEAVRPEDRDNDESHGTTPSTVERELKAAGFTVVHTEPAANRWFMVVAAKPR